MLFQYIKKLGKFYVQGAPEGALELKLRVFPYQRKKLIDQSLDKIDVVDVTSLYTLNNIF